MLDDSINCNAWYFRVADVAAPVVIVLAGVMAVYASYQFVTSF